MALQLSYTDKHKVTHAAAYAMAVVTKQKKIKSGGDYHVEYCMNVYADSAKTNAVPVATYNYTFTVSKELSTPVMTQCYIDAKTIGS